MRQRERDMLRQLEDTRQQFDEVRQQNGELTSRLTEELGLSKRLQDQLAEVEERFFHHQPAADQNNDVSPALKMGRMVKPRPLGLRSDEVEVPPERERPPMPEMPPVINEADEAMCSLDGSHGDLPPEFPLRSDLDGELDEYRAIAELGINRSLELRDGICAREHVPMEVTVAVATADSGNIYDSVQQRQPSQQPLQQQSAARKFAVPGQYPREVSAEEVLVMESKLRSALDKASFECAVVRVQNGVYNFGPLVRAVVELRSDGDVAASRDDGATWEPIDDFIRSIAKESNRSLAAQVQSARAWVSPMAAGDTSGQAPQEQQPPPAAAGAQPMAGYCTRSASYTSGTAERRGPRTAASKHGLRSDNLIDSRSSSHGRTDAQLNGPAVAATSVGRTSSLKSSATYVGKCRCCEAWRRRYIAEQALATHNLSVSTWCG
eukprot:gnl/TRDRNA2_/TRDRNA2_172802_c0_seq9.p1 gnl/TRDRNA2_/TRDRNA2_172802_c0~~gnl/TRDRNA2_/TRDRNA2_172802_c0_seq9.p1  ORF type:complete len:436 (-),score=67.40 gnl/TRDRNA2_/TRDRNA2_172802_c0_seq9:56-1363(-)